MNCVEIARYQVVPPFKGFIFKNQPIGAGFWQPSKLTNIFGVDFEAVSNWHQFLATRWLPIYGQYETSHRSHVNEASLRYIPWKKIKDETNYTSAGEYMLTAIDKSDDTIVTDWDEFILSQTDKSFRKLF